MNTIVGTEVKELAATMTDLAIGERVFATSQGAVVVLALEGIEREAIQRYRRAHKARRLGL